MVNRVLIGDISDCLAILEDGSIDCAITSPPYWNQRDYEFDGQIGQEKTFIAYCERLTSVFSILHKKLSEKGVFYLNIGDKYLTKYGNTPLGLIPYILAHYMELDGWILDDILIWYKIGHMPSSIKNRFTNTYEPVFVLARNKENYHSQYRLKKLKQNNYTNIMKISLQSTLVKHMAVYPEKLVESLIKRGIPDEGTICDPFAGSGTTGKAVLNLNGFNLLFSRNIARKFIMIEGNRDFVDIIVKRTAFNSKRVEHVPRKETSIKPALRIKPVDITEKYRAKHHIDFLFSRSTIKIIEDTQDKEALFRTLISSRAKETFPDDGILYMGLKNVSLLDFYHLSQIIDHGWVIRNMLVIVQEDQGNKNWFPVFFIVKDQKRKKYRFNLDNIRIQHKHDTNETWKDTDFHNFRVVDRFSSKNEQLDGIITELRSVHSDGMPEKVVISWNDGKTSLEYVIHEEDWWDNLLIACPICNGAILDKEMFFFKLKCPNCGKILWNGLETLPEFKEQDDSTMVSLPEKSVDKDNTVTKRTSRNRNYNGKFIGTKRINLGQSPGARASTQEMFFSVVRRYNINQPLVCDLLNFYRNNKNLTKKALTERFSPEYIHTVGHWLRKDMGGSIPTPTDLTTLATILDIPEDYVTLLNRRGLKLQTVKKSVKGKNPGDFLEGDINEIKKILAKSIR